MTDTITPYRSSLPAARDNFPRLLRAEWTKFRTVRGWVIGTVVAALIMVLIGLLTAAGSRSKLFGVITTRGRSKPARRTVPQFGLSPS